MSRPDPVHVSDFIRHANDLASLRALARESQQRYAAIEALLPAAMRPHIRDAGLDNGIWFLLCPNAAAASKLRQLLPRLMQALQAAHLPTREIQLKIKRPY